MNQNPSACFFVLLASFAAGLAAQSTSVPPTPRADAIRVSGRPGLHPWQSGLRGFGDSYRVTFTEQGMRFLPDLVGATVDQHLQLTPQSLLRGGHNVCELRPRAPRQLELAVDFEHAPGVREHYDLTAEHVALSWVFDERPAGSGDLVVRYAIDTVLPEPTEGADGGLEFVAEGIGGVRIGGVTGIDAEGREVAGALRWVGGELELRLPAAFVDVAVYPMVLDPVIGSASSLADGTLDNEFLDAAYDRGTDQFLMLYRKRVNTWEHDLRGIYVDPLGTLSGPFTIATGLLVNGVPIRAGIANLANEGVFGITYLRDVAGPPKRIEFLTVTAGSQMVDNLVTAAYSATSGLGPPDIGSEVDAAAGTGRGFVVVYDRADVGTIEARRIYFDTSGQLILPSATVVMSDLSGAITIDYRQPVVAKAAANAGDLLLVTEVTTQGFLEGVATRLIRSDSGTVVTGPTIQPIGTDLSDPEVDGYQGRWVIAYRETQGTPSSAKVTARSLQFDGSALALGAPSSFSPTLEPEMPLVAYTPGRTWLGYEYQNFGPRGGVVAIDSRQCVDCLDTSSTSSRPSALATMTSGGVPGGEHAVFGWSDGTDMYVQRLRNYGSAASVVGLGGGCGNGGGTAQVSHAPGIGSSGLVCSVDSLPPTALVTIFNFAPPQPPVTCGSCIWVPFGSTVQTPIVGGRAEVQFPIPCLPSLISQQFETQWTSFDPTQNACPLLPGLVLSERLLLTIDN